jgi:hypothetical protein
MWLQAGEVHGGVAVSWMFIEKWSEMKGILNFVANPPHFHGRSTWIPV